MSDIKKIYLLDKAPQWFSQDIANSINEKVEINIYSTTDEVFSNIEDSNISDGSVILNLGQYGSKGIDLVQELKTNFPSLKIIAVFENESILKKSCVSFEDLIRLGISDVFLKPVKAEMLVKSLKGAHGINGFIDNQKGNEEKVEVTANDKDFSPIPLDSISPNRPVQFDIFVRLKDGHYVKVLLKGDSFDQSFLDRYKNKKGVKHFYFLSKDRLAYIKMCNDLSSKMSQVMGAESEERLQNQSLAIEKYIEEVYEHGINDEVLELGKEVCSNVVELVESESDFQNIMNIIEEMGTEQMDHSFLVSFLASMIALKFSWNSDLITTTINMACIFHDIGKSKLPKELRTKKAISMSKSELEEYQKHPIYGAEILNEHKQINPTVVQIVLQHHENCDGTGFPHALQASKILNLTKVVSFCDEMAHLMKEKKISAPNAFELLMKDPFAEKRFSLDILDKFREICDENSKPDVKQKAS